MPYRANADLPDQVRDHLPPHAQNIYREAFNHAFASRGGDVRREEIAHRIAWAAVKRTYVKVGDTWQPSQAQRPAAPMQGAGRHASRRSGASRSRRPDDG